MKELTLISWNVNGIRSLSKKVVYKNMSFREWVQFYSPHIICIQETKASQEQVPASISMIPGYHTYWSSAVRKGYSGVLTYTKARARSVNKNLGIEKFDIEGRMLETEFKHFVLFNVYFPNGKSSKERLDYKMEFYDVFLEYIEKVRSKGKPIIVCGDVNTAHKEIDLARPKENETISGFLPQEREWITKLIDHGYYDTFRLINGDIPNKYSWWSMRTRARERNVGWRIDYFFVSEELKNSVTDAFILDEIYGSDHCPIGIKINVP
ncbi:MAG: exodeoxyribonuclease III [Candidatus Heimdallarchaeaceae archaeon]